MTKILNKRSAVEGKMPTADQLDYGELAVNYNANNPFISIKDSNDQVVKLGIEDAPINDTIYVRQNGSWINLPIIDLWTYGIEWDTTIADPTLTRIGNPLYHKSLPIQSAYRGCVANGNVINYYLDPNDWSKKIDGTPSVLDGTDGQVRVHTPRFYGKSGAEGTKKWVRISTIKIDDSWTEIPEMVIDAYRCTIDRTNPGNLKTASVVNTSVNFRGGNGTSPSTSHDQYLSTDPFRTWLGKPVSMITRQLMREYAQNAESELLSYNVYKWIFYWNWVIEYATFNSQASYNAELTSEGYRQGGMGDGLTTWNALSWFSYLGNIYAITPCGYGNNMGNGSGIKELVIPAFASYDSFTFQVPRWRGFDNPFGDIFTNIDGFVAQYNAAKTKVDIFATWDNTHFEDVVDNMTLAGEQMVLGGNISDYDLGSTGEIIPSRYNNLATTYMCDDGYSDTQTTSNTLLVGGDLIGGAFSGFGCFYSYNAVSFVDARVGFRTLSRVKI